MTEFFFNLSNYSLIAKISVFLSYPFAYFLIFIVFFWILLFSKKKMYNFSLVFLSTFFSWSAAVILKDIFRIDRPFAPLNIVSLFREPGFSFPSEHAAIFMALTISLFFINKKIGYLFLFFAILIGLSRVVIGFHFFIDILGGFLIGLGVSFIFIKIFKKI